MRGEAQSLKKNELIIRKMWLSFLFTSVFSLVCIICLPPCLSKLIYLNSLNTHRCEFMQIHTKTLQALL